MLYLRAKLQHTTLDGLLLSDGPLRATEVPQKHSSVLPGKLNQFQGVYTQQIAPPRGAWEGAGKDIHCPGWSTWGIFIPAPCVVYQGGTPQKVPNAVWWSIRDAKGTLIQSQGIKGLSWQVERWCLMECRLSQQGWKFITSKKRGRPGDALLLTP